MTNIPTITDTASLVSFCTECSHHPYVTIDTEFLRDKTYYSKLCLIQAATPDQAVIIDPLANDLDLSPFYKLLSNPKIIKVFHAARQDLEIFYHETGTVPHPVFDTQIAAMVCGYGDQIGYASLVKDLCDVELDKGQQFTDWARRPLSNKQLIYALADVTWLRVIYQRFKDTLEQQKRIDWIAEEMAILQSDQTYKIDPQEAWKRIKVRSNKPQVFAVLKSLAAWREETAREKNLPRPRIIKDDTLASLAMQKPDSVQKLRDIRGLPERYKKEENGQILVTLIQESLSQPENTWPQKKSNPRYPDWVGPAVEMLKMVLRINTMELGIAPRLIADPKSLEKFCMIGNNGITEEDIPFLHGWRYDIFGHDAQKLLSGKLALGFDNKKPQKLAP